MVALAGREFVVAISDSDSGPRVRLDDEPLTLELHPASDPLVCGHLGGKPFRAAARVRGDRVDVAIAGESLEVEVRDQRRQLLSQVSSARLGLASGETIRAPMPGLVVAVPARVGETVARGASVVVLQAMKMENELRAAVGGRVAEVRVQVGQPVEQGQVLVVLE